MDKIGLLLVSHSEDLVRGLARLLREVAPSVPLTLSGGLEDGSLGTSFAGIQAALEENAAQRLLVFYDLGSARMNLEIVAEMTEKELEWPAVPLVEGAYTAAALLEAGADWSEIQAQLAELTIDK